MPACLSPVDVRGSRKTRMDTRAGIELPLRGGWADEEVIMYLRGTCMKNREQI